MDSETSLVLSGQMPSVYFERETDHETSNCLILTRLNTCRLLFNVFLTATLFGRYFYYLIFIVEETEA